MLKTAAPLFIFFVTSTQALSIIRITNGTDAREGEFKYVVSLRGHLMHDCGASILNEKFVLTAAHCVCDYNGHPMTPTIWSIQYGSVSVSATEERSIPVSNIACPDFDPAAEINDVAVLELETPLPSDDDSWEPVKLSRDFQTTVDQKGVIVGWGMLWDNGPYSTTLQKLEVNIYTDEICGVQFKPEHHICFGAPLGGACTGDSGSALISADGEQVGVASLITATCGIANPEHPNVYARVSRYIDWIEEQSRL